MGNRLKFLREDAGWTHQQAADAMGISRSQFIKLERGERRLTLQYIQLAARAFGVSNADIIEEADTAEVITAPIVGLAGAGPDGSVLFAEGDGNFGEVPMPIGAAPETVALEVRGSSMHGLANDGWLIFYEERTEPRAEYMGEPCVCWLTDGHVLVKIPQPTRDPGLFHLESVNAPTMRDVPVGEMALVTDIKTRRAAERFIKRNPDQPVQDVKLRK